MQPPSNSPRPPPHSPTRLTSSSPMSTAASSPAAATPGLIPSPSPPPPGRHHDADLKRWLEYAASCGVEDLRLVVSVPSLAATSFHLGRRIARRFDRGVVTSAFFHSLCECSNLVHLTICDLHLYSPTAIVKRLSSLEVLTLHAIIAACPFIRSLDLCLCRNLRCSGAVG